MKHSNGFTLIELLAVLGIIALLSTVSVPVMKRVDTQRKNDEDIPQPMPEQEWFQVDVITCAAHTLRRGSIPTKQR